MWQNQINISCFRTVLFGNFYKGQMVSGKHCAVVGSTSHCSFFCGVMEPVISKPKGKVSWKHCAHSAAVSWSQLFQNQRERWVEALCWFVCGAMELIISKPRKGELEALCLFLCGVMEPVISKPKEKVSWKHCAHSFAVSWRGSFQNQRERWVGSILLNRLWCHWASHFKTQGKVNWSIVLICLWCHGGSHFKTKGKVSWKYFTQLSVLLWS